MKICRHLKKFKFWRQSVALFALVCFLVEVRRRRLQHPGPHPGPHPRETPSGRQPRDVQIVPRNDIDSYDWGFRKDDEKEIYPFKGPCQDTPHLHLAMAVCEGNASAIDVMVSLDRQLEQIQAAMKSAVFLSKCPIVIHIITTVPIFDAIVEVTQGWPEHQLEKAILQFHETWFPNDHDHLATAFRPCSSQRLFLTKVLFDVDAVLYFDTDYVFLRSPERLWEELQNFAPFQAAAAAPPRFYPDMGKEDRPPDNGVNAGLLVLNLTRLRAVPGGWEAMVLATLSREHAGDDQDVLNAIFEENPEYLRLLDCRWNFRHFFCTHTYLRTMCPASKDEGAFGVHGVTGAFQDKEDGVLRALYLTWRNLDLSKSKEDLVQNLKTNLASAKTSGSCHLYKHIVRILTHQLEHGN